MPASYPRSLVKPLPPLEPGRQQQVDQFHANCVQVFDRYLHGVEMDMNRHAVKHGPMDAGRAHTDLTRILAKQIKSGEIPANMVAGLLAEAVLRGVASKGKGRR